MGKKDPALTLVPTLVAERLRIWGMCVRKQRIAQGMRADDLCQRMGISHPTLQRLQRGEASVGAGLYLAALQILGMLEFAAPMVDNKFWQTDQPNARARPEVEIDDDYF